MARIRIRVGCVAFVLQIVAALPVAAALNGHLLSQASAHDAPSGWSYAPECCSNHDCREIKDDAVSLVTGGWRIKATGEIMAQQEVRQSRDGRFHRCSSEGREDARTYCLYVPEFGS
jgi:hypothetical protein